MRRTAFLCVLLALLLGSSAAAQPTVSMRGNVGAAFFRSPEALNSLLNSGVNLGGGAGIEILNGVEVVVEGSYDRFTLNSDNIALFAQNLSVGTRVKGGALNVLNATVGLRYVLRDKGNARPYMAAGIGVYRTVLEETRILRTDQTLPRREAITRGYHAAIGSRFQINDTYSFFFEPRYVLIDTGSSESFGINSATRYVTIRLGVDVHL